MRDDFPSLLLRQPVIHRPVQVVCDLPDLAGSNQRADRNETPIPGSKVRSQPKVTEQNISGVLNDSRSDVTELLFNGRCTLGLCVLV